MFKSCIMGLTAFVYSHIIMTLMIVALFVLKISNPFKIFYQPQKAVFYILLSSLLFVPAYFLFGVINAKLCKIKNDKKTLLAVFVCCELMQIISWLFITTLWEAGSEGGGIFTLLLNAPAGWVLMPMSYFYDMSSALNIVFYILPSAAFVSGIYASGKL